MTDYARTLPKVTACVADSLALDPDEVALGSRLIPDLGADSLDTVELVMEFEKSFNVQIPDEDAEKIATVGDAINYLKGKLGA